jgi:hypothetical protein
MSKFASILNVNHQLPHLTVFITDFPEGIRLLEQMADAISSYSKILMVNIHENEDLLMAINEAALEKQLKIQEYAISGYTSFQLLIRRHESFEYIRQVIKMFLRRDVARLELPPLGFDVTHHDLNELCSVVLAADYIEQKRYSDEIFDALGTNDFYGIECSTDSGIKLEINDCVPLFDLAGPLQEGDERILPGGEVAYTGSQINGCFKVTGGLLATATQSSGISRSKKLMALSHRIPAEPLYFDIHSGKVQRVWSQDTLANEFSELFPVEKHPEITEVGFSFNAACQKLIHTWPSSANEGVPGVHIALGGDPGHTLEVDQRTDVHVDLISPKATIKINNRNVRLF